MRVLGGARLWSLQPSELGSHSLNGPPSPALWRGESTGSRPQAAASAALGRDSDPPDRPWPLSLRSLGTCLESFGGMSAWTGAASNLGGPLLLELHCTQSRRWCRPSC